MLTTDGPTSASTDRAADSIWEIGSGVVSFDDMIVSILCDYRS